MKIKATNAPALVRHLSVLAKLSDSDTPYPFEVFFKLQRLETKAHRIVLALCDEGTPQQHEALDKGLDKLELQVKKLLPNAKTLFINQDPRGYSLKLKESEAKKLGIHSDWGGYGIIAPEF